MVEENRDTFEGSVYIKILSLATNIDTNWKQQASN